MDQTGKTIDFGSLTNDRMRSYTIVGLTLWPMGKTVDL